ncbi:MAG: hypothetical protein HKN10_00395 [Myxococcales bacterium]|nr:hypothetical protein [Myxococcales bacterium]
MSERLEGLGAEVARIQDDALADGRRRAAVRRQLVSDAADAPPELRPARWGPALAWAGAMVAIALAFVALWPRAAVPVAYRVEGEAESRLIDRSVTATVDRPMSIAFTDGSAVRLGPSARARVSQLTVDGATLRLEHGEATVSVRHRTATRWSVEAGPFVVRVTGTRFRVGWRPEQESFDLAVFEGEVRVDGPDAPERVLRSGDEMHRTLAPATLPKPPPPIEDPAPAARERIQTVTPSRAPTYEPPVRASPRPSPSRPSAPPLELRLPPKEPSAEAELKPAQNEPAPEASPPEEPEPIAEAASSDAATEAAPPQPAWQTLLVEGKHRELLTALGPDQVEQAIWQAGPNDLIDLGAEARQLGDPRAGYIYSVVRSRFAATDAAADAAFLLGRMQFHSGAYQASATWFQTYVRERPRGRFAREAAGRLVEAYHQAGDQDRARDAARQYLSRYPNGPHATLAATVLE